MLNDNASTGPGSDEHEVRTRARAGAAVGGVLGLLLGAVIGWLLGAPAGPVPVIGPVVGQGALASTIGGLLVGLAIGALVGGLAGALFTVSPEEAAEEIEVEAARARHAPPQPSAEVPEAAERAETSAARIVRTPAAPPITPSWTAVETLGTGEEIDQSKQALEKPWEQDTVGEPESEHSNFVDDDLDTDPNLSAEEVEESESGSDDGMFEDGAPEPNRGPDRASADWEMAAVTPLAGDEAATAGETSGSSMEATEMADTSGVSDEREQLGRNPNNTTGTEDAINPDTGALGTAGTPLTTGYGVSGSTIGTGSAYGQAEHESDDFHGATPGTRPYERGGQGSDDSQGLRGAERGPSAVQKHSDAGRAEADVQREPSERDIYESTPGYGENLERGGNLDPTDLYAGSDVDSPPSYANAGMDRSQASPSTDIPGTSNMAGLGDNTDDAHPNDPLAPTDRDS